MRRHPRPSARGIVKIEALECRLQCAASALNTALGGTGIVKSLFRTTNDFLDVVTQKDGKIVAVGQAQTTKQTKDVVVARFNTNGTVDTTFGGGTGRAFLGFTSTSDDIATSVAIDAATQKIVIAGVTGTGVATDMFAARYTKTGALDTTFGTGGKLKIDFNGKTDAATGLVVESDGKVILGGFSGTVSMITTVGAGMYTAMVRLLPNGTLDTTFGTGGRFTGNANVGAVELGGRLVRQADGKYVLACTRIVITTGIHTSMGAVRVNSNGTFDSTFGFFGHALGPSGPTLQIATGIALDPVTNNVVVGGTLANGMVDFHTTLPAGFTLPAVPAATMANFQVYRFKGVGGKLDTTFSGDGIQLIDFKSGSASRLDAASSVQVDAKGKVYLFGASQLTGQMPDFAAARLLTNGSLDTTFDGDGKRLYNIGGSDGIFGARRGSGQILVVGHSKSNGGKNYAILAGILV